MNELKRCPFCGGEAKLSKGTKCWGHGDYATSITISCKDCCAEVEVADYLEEDLKEKAIKLWNTRTPVDKVIERLEEVAKRCEKEHDSDGLLSIECAI